RLFGIDPESEGEPITDIVRQIRAGEYTLGPTESGYPPLLIGDGLADRFQAHPGVVIEVISLQGAEVNIMGLPQPVIRRFEVVGRFHTGMYDYDNHYMYTTLAAAQDIARLGDAVTGLWVTTPDADTAAETALRIEDS